MAEAVDAQVAEKEADEKATHLSEVEMIKGICSKNKPEIMADFNDARVCLALTKGKGKGKSGPSDGPITMRDKSGRKYNVDMVSVLAQDEISPETISSFIKPGKDVSLAGAGAEQKKKFGRGRAQKGKGRGRGNGKGKGKDKSKDKNGNGKDNKGKGRSKDKGSGKGTKGKGKKGKCGKR